MQWTLLLYGLVPLLVFAVVDSYAGIKWAVYSAIACALADIVVTRILTRAWDPGTLVAFALILLLGGATLRLNNSVYVKMQPVAMSVLYAALVAYFQFFGGGFITKYLPLLADQMSPEYRGQLEQPGMIPLLDHLTTGFIGVFLVTGAWIAWAAQKKSTKTWLLVRAFGFYAVTAVYILAFMGLMVGRALMGGGPGLSG